MIEGRSEKDTTGIIRPDPQTSISKDHQFPSLSESLSHPRPLVNSFILEKLNYLLKLISPRRWWWWQRYVWQMVQYQYPRGLRAFFRYRCEPLIIPDIKSQIISRMMRSLLRCNTNWLNQINRIIWGVSWDGKVSKKKKEAKFHLLKIPIDTDVFCSTLIDQIAQWMIVEITPGNWRKSGILWDNFAPQGEQPTTYQS